MTVPDASAGTDAGKSSKTIPVITGQDSKINQNYQDRLIRNVPQEVLKNRLFCGWRLGREGRTEDKGSLSSCYWEEYQK